MNYPQGSEWRKWDLHVHTPASINQNYGGDNQAAWDAFFEDLERLPPEFKVLGINDYIFIDGYRKVLSAKQTGRLANIDLILPVIELRVDKFGGTESLRRVNFHILFDALDPDLIAEQFISGLTRGYTLTPEYRGINWQAKPTRQSLEDLGRLIIESVPQEKRPQFGSPLAEGFANLNFNLDVVRSALASHYFRDRYLTAVGKTEWDAIKWNDNTIADKKDLINTVNVIFTSSENLQAFHKSHAALKKAGVNTRLLDCSDAHQFSSAKHKDRIGKCFTWIKADTTFRGLLHAIEEYGQRVFVGDEPEKLRQVRASPTKFIEVLDVRKEAHSSLPQPWFDVRLPLNKDLVAIIGNKGSGKSALADISGLLGDTRNYSHFSFLNSSKFRNPRANLAQHFRAAIAWRSGPGTSRNLDEMPDITQIETIKYLPQNYIETICNEISATGEGVFDAELKKIIFAHVPASERLGRQTLDELAAYKTEAIARRINDLVGEVSDLNARILNLEDQLDEEFRRRLDAQLTQKQSELDAHIKAKPPEVADPALSEQAQEGLKRIREEIEAKQKGLASSQTELKELQEKRAALAKNIAIAERISGKLTNAKRNFDLLLADIQSELALLPVEPPWQLDQLISVRVDGSKVEALAVKLRQQRDEIDKKIDPHIDGSLARHSIVLAEEIKRLNEALDEPTRKFLKYKSDLEGWERVRLSLIGAADMADSLTGLQARILGLAAIPAALTSLKDQRTQKAREVYAQHVAIRDVYKELYAPVQNYIDRSEANRQQGAPFLAFEAKVVQEGFATTFLGRINRQVRGTFAGVEESNEYLKKLFAQTDFNDEHNTIAFLTRIDEALHTDARDEEHPVAVRVRDQLRKGETAQTLYDYIYSLSFLLPRYTLRYGDRQISQLSPGERGLLLLVFYLLVDKDDIPLIIDQPEENLDNQTIFSVLVQCLREVKQRRQVIIVTHNPNLAVVCDAEQIIYASHDKANNVFNYVAGAIENPTINKHIIDVLEGTRPAFESRDSKYFA